MWVWSEVLLGTALVAGGFWLVKTVYCWIRFRKSIQMEVYSNYLEYSIRRKKITRLSESWYFKSEFGKHRIFYQLAQTKKEKVPQAYVLIMLTSGLYILNVKNQSGKIYAKKKGDFRQIYTEKGKNGTEHTYLFKNPLEESRYFENQIRKRLTEETVPIQSLVVFPQKSEIIWEQEEDAEIPVIHRKQLFEWIKTDFEVNQGRLAEKKIDGIYQELAEESIAAEKEM